MQTSYMEASLHGDQNWTCCLHIRPPCGQKAATEIQGDHDGKILHYVDFIFEDPQSCPTVLPFLPNFHLAQAELGRQWNDRSKADKNLVPDHHGNPVLRSTYCALFVLPWMGKGFFQEQDFISHGASGNGQVSAPRQKDKKVRCLSNTLRVSE